MQFQLCVEFNRHEAHSQLPVCIQLVIKIKRVKVNFLNQVGGFPTLYQASSTWSIRLWIFQVSVSFELVESHLRELYVWSTQSRFGIELTSWPGPSISSNSHVISGVYFALSCNKTSQVKLSLGPTETLEVEEPLEFNDLLLFSAKLTGKVVPRF